MSGLSQVGWALPTRIPPSRPAPLPAGGMASRRGRLTRRRPTSLYYILAFLALAAAFATLLALLQIPTAVQADNTQLLLAVERMALGLGPTTIYPRIPATDFAFITHWPIGYPLLICALKTLTGLHTLTICQTLNVAAYALALLAWTAWFRRCLPDSITARLLALTAALLALVPIYLTKFTTDMILVAATPLLLFAADRAVRLVQQPSANARRSALRFFLLGLAAAALVWIRYTALFLPIAIGLFLLLRGCRAVGWALPTIRSRLTTVLIPFFLGAALPVLSLAAINAAFGPSLIDRPAGGFHPAFHPSWIADFWQHFCALPLFTTHWRATLALTTLIPIGSLSLMLLTPAARRAARAFLARPKIALSLCAFAGFFLLVTAFRILAPALYDPASESRYLLPVRPLYLLFFVGPLLSLPWNRFRRLCALPILACLAWLLLAEWAGPLRALAANAQPPTPYGQRALWLGHDAAELYPWLKAQDAPDLVVFSNFYDYIALETGIPAQPLPADMNQLADRLERITRARGIQHPRVLFVLAPDNLWRTYLPQPADLIRTFNLHPLPTSIPALSRHVFTPHTRALSP